MVIEEYMIHKFFRRMKSGWVNQFMLYMYRCHLNHSLFLTWLLICSHFCLL